LLIHEGQLIYAVDGLQKADLGEWWFERTNGLLLPLGAHHPSISVSRRCASVEDAA
jgi:predicted solute-binding protein